MAVTDTIIRFTTSTKPTITVKENSIDNTLTSLVLYGKSTLNTSDLINTNLLYILENFCSDSAPRKSIEGQIWFNTSDPDNRKEYGRIQIKITDNSGLHFHDIAGTVMNIDGNLRHTGQIEAVDEYNVIDQNHKLIYPEDLSYNKFITTKKHCDENYLSGEYSTDNSIFNVRGDRKIKTPTTISFTKPGLYDDDRFKLINKKYLDTQFLTGQNFEDHFIIPSNTKKLYYSAECVIDLPYQLITKKYVDDQDAAARIILDSLVSGSTDGLEQFVLDAEAAALAAKIAADEAWTALGAISPQTATSVITFTSGGTTVTSGGTMMDVSIPTVNSYIGTNTKPIITGLLTTEKALASTATYTIEIDTVPVPAANITTNPISTGVEWSIDTAFLNWATDTTHDVIVTRIEDATHSYVSATHDQIKITSNIIPTVNTQTISSTALKCTITGTIGDAGFVALPDKDSIKVVFNALTYYRYNDPANTDNSSALTVTGGDWTLTDVTTPPVGTWDVSVCRNEEAAQVDNTTDEITVASLKDPVLPTVDPKVVSGKGTEVTNVTVTGTVGGKNLTDSSSTFTVAVLDGTTPVTGTLTYDVATGKIWTYTIPTISTGKTYNVVATRTDEYNNTFVDNTTDELKVQKILDDTLPTVVPKSAANGATVDVTGTVGSVNLTTSNSTFTVVVKDNVSPFIEETGTLTYDSTGINWTYSLTTVPEGKTYNVIATRVDQYNNTYVDTTVNELVVASASLLKTVTVNGQVIEICDAATGQIHDGPQNCLDFVNKLNAHGHTDWRCPTITEMKAIYDELVVTGLDTSFTNISGAFAASTTHRWFWASIDVAHGSWTIDMTNRDTQNMMQYKNMWWWIRAVRTQN